MVHMLWKEYSEFNFSQMEMLASNPVVTAGNTNLELRNEIRNMIYRFRNQMMFQILHVDEITQED